MSVIEQVSGIRQPLGADHDARLMVFAADPGSVARVVPVDDLGAVALALNSLPTGDVVYVDRWSAAAAMGRCDAF